MQGIVYHYLRNTSQEFPNLKYLNKKNFIKQIKYLKKKKKISNFENKKKNSFFLSFDDGLKEHLWAARKLKKLNLSAIFFINSYPLIKKDFLKVHKVHLLLGKYNYKILYSKLKSICKIDEIKVNKKYREMKRYQFNKAKSQDEIKSLELKVLLNSTSFDNESSIVNDLFNLFFTKKKQKKLFNKFYLNLQEIHKIKNMGMKIGAHSHSHFLMTSLNKKNLIQEIDTFKKFLVKNKLRTNLFSYPYGFKDSYNSVTNNLLLKKNFKELFVVNNPNQKNQKNMISRLNCNYFKHGQIK